jgi:hypothetical protein
MRKLIGHAHVLRIGSRIWNLTQLMILVIQQLTWMFSECLGVPATSPSFRRSVTVQTVQEMSSIFSRPYLPLNCPIL